MGNYGKIAVVVIIVIVFWVFAEKANAAGQITPTIIGIKPQGNIDVSTARSLPVNAEVALNNFGKANVNVNQIFLEIYDETGEKLLASQTSPMPESVRVTSNSSTKINIPFTISTANIIQFLFSGNVVQAGVNLARFAIGGKLGKTILLRGFVRGEQIRVPLETKIEL